MPFKTLLDLRTKIERDLDLEAEEFVQPQEMIEYINDAIAISEAEIVKLGLRDKYFLTRYTFSVVKDQEDYTLPANVYANKILKLVYQNGATLYTLRPMDSKDMFEDIQFLNKYVTTEFYRYLIRHDLPGEERIQIVPKGRLSVANAITVWYYRDANKLSVDTDVCDLPEICYQFIYQSVRTRVYEKEKGTAWREAMNDLLTVRNLMVETLTQQIVDADLTEVEKDMNVYWEHS